MQSDTLRFLRMAKNLKQKTIADLLEMSQPNYSNLENGKTRISSEIAGKLAGYYGVSQELLLSDTHSIINPAGVFAIPSKEQEQFAETHKELLDPILERMEMLLNILADEKEELTSERRQLSAVFDRLALKFGDAL